MVLPPARPRRPRPYPIRIRGFALIEALIALLIFSLAVLGLVGLQAAMTRASTGAKYRAEATYLATDLIGRMWSNRAMLKDFSDCQTSSACQTWLSRVADTLPAGTAIVSVIDRIDTALDDTTKVAPYSVSEVTVRVRWQPPGESAAHEFSTTTVISANPAS
ncbi:MAG: type pilus modification protein PilV [Pseudomonadota bacterium]|jgi:type IV pilus assembly protein PilV